MTATSAGGFATGGAATGGVASELAPTAEAILGTAVSASAAMAMRPRHSASRPTATHAATAGPEPGFPAERGEALLRIPAKELRARKTTGDTREPEREQAESRAGAAAPVHCGLQRLNRVAAGEERRHVLRPLRQRRELHRHSADDQHRQKNALPEGLHRRHVVRERGDHEPEPDERKRDERERHPQIERMGRQRHPDREGEGELEQARREDDGVARQHGARDHRPGRHRREPVPPPYAALALAHQRGRQSKTGAPQHRDGQQLPHVAQQRNFLVPIQHPERDEENQRNR